MIRVAHRINSSLELKNIPYSFGIEVDLRSINSKIILGHDFPANGEEFTTFLKSYSHKLLILNVKEDGLESAIMELLNERPEIEYFFLDQPFPTILKSIKNSICTSIRVSEYEDMPKKVIGAEWIWIDSFSGDWNHIYSALDYAEINQMKTCLVSPELQGRFDLSETEWLLQNFKERLDAVCTKKLSIWA